MSSVSEKFKPPKKSDINAWKTTAYLIDNGFYFYSKYDENGYRVPYPTTMEEAIEFVSKYKKQ